MLLIQPKPWNIKPPVGAQIQRSHPAAQGLTSCVLFNSGSAFSLIDLIGNRAWAYVNAGAGLSSAQTPWGLAYGGAATASVYSLLPPVAPLLGNPGPFSVLMGFRAGSLAASNNYVYEEDLSGSVQLALLYGFVSQKIEFFSVGGVGGNPRTSSQINVPDLNLHLYGYTYKGQSNEWASWFDGVKTVINANISFIPANASPASADRRFLDANGGGAPTNGFVLFFYVWNRYVDMAQFQTNPYCFFQPQSPTDRFWTAAVAPQAPFVSRHIVQQAVRRASLW